MNIDFIIKFVSAEIIIEVEKLFSSETNLLLPAR